MLVYEVAGYAKAPVPAPGWRWHHANEGTRHALDGQTGLYSARGRDRHLHWLASDRGVEAIAECLRVQTMAYRGVWIERLRAASPLARRALASALAEWAKEEGLDEVGYLHRPGGDEDTPPGEDLERIPLLRAGYSSVGRYHVFTGESP